MIAPLIFSGSVEAFEWSKLVIIIIAVQFTNIFPMEMSSFIIQLKKRQFLSTEEVPPILPQFAVAVQTRLMDLSGVMLMRMILSYSSQQMKWFSRVTLIIRSLKMEKFIIENLRDICVHLEVRKVICTFSCLMG